MAKEVKRSANFTSSEEGILLCLVKKYKSILENKKTDSNINKKKIECWKQIEKEFNNESGQILRDCNALRKKYENIKKNTKKKLADEKCYTMGTGGGPSKKPPELTDIDMEIKSILGDRIEGLASQFGGDAEMIAVTNTASDIIPMTETIDVFNSDIITGLNDMSPMTEIEDVLCNEATTKENSTKQLEASAYLIENSTKPDWSKISIENLKTPKSKALTPEHKPSKRRRDEYDVLSKKVSHWAGAKANLEAEKLKKIEDEYNTKIRLMEEKHQLETELMRKESEARIKKIEEEMEATVTGIKEQNKLKREILLLEKHRMIEKRQKNI